MINERLKSIKFINEILKWTLDGHIIWQVRATQTVPGLLGADSCFSAVVNGKEILLAEGAATLRFEYRSGDFVTKYSTNRTEVVDKNGRVVYEEDVELGSKRLRHKSGTLAREIGGNRASLMLVRDASESESWAGGKVIADPHGETSLDLLLNKVRTAVLGDGREENAALRSILRPAKSVNDFIDQVAEGRFRP